MLSSKDGVFDKARGRMVGSQDYLTKPFTKDQLLQTVQQFGAAAAPIYSGVMMPIQKVLVVDDSKTELMFMTDLLQKNGFAVKTAENAEDAFRRLAEDKPDLILMDVVMPGQNGFQLTRAITRDPLYADVPIIMCTSKNQETDRVWGMRQGARDYITKPVDADELMAKIKALG
jgi:twitching motility two-component system response regulator PilH